MLERVGRFRVEERIGEGAMADVFRAYDPSIHRTLAIKVLKAEYRQIPEYAQRFLREAKAAGALNHPNIVTIYDVGEVDGYPYIAMELIEGKPLNEILAEKGKIEPSDVINVALQLADALQYAHGQNVVHRDIKPSNIMLLKDGRTLRILDFGIARVAEQDPLLGEDEGVKTQIGQVLGSPRYMSPEQALGRELDGRSDLFSTGVVLYELLTGKKAFAGASPATLALQITQQEPPPMAEAAADTPRGLQFIINKLLAKRPDRRFVDGAQLAAALRREQNALASVLAEKNARRRYVPLQVRTTLLVASMTAALLLVSIFTVLNRQDAAMLRVALTSGSQVSSFVAHNAALRAADNATLPPEQRDWLPTQAFVQSAAGDPNVRQMIVADSEGIIRGASDPALIGRPYRKPAGEPVVRQGKEQTVTRTPDGHRFTRPIVYAGQTFGQLDMTLSRAELAQASGLSHVLMIVLGLVVLGGVGLASYVVARSLAQPIGRLKAALADAATGNLDFRISHHRKDEFGELYDAFNLMSANLQERLEATQGYALDQEPARPAPGHDPLLTVPAEPRGPFAPPPADAIRPGGSDDDLAASADPFSPFAPPAEPSAAVDEAERTVVAEPQGSPYRAKP